MKLYNNLIQSSSLVDFPVCYSAETLSEDEEDSDFDTGDGVSISSMPKFTNGASEFIPTPGGPFSALTPSMWPQDVMQRLEAVSMPSDTVNSLSFVHVMGM